MTDKPDLIERLRVKTPTQVLPDNVQGMVLQLLLNRLDAERAEAADALEKYEECLLVAPEYKVEGSHIGSVQNYISALEAENERLRDKIRLLRGSIAEILKREAAEIERLRGLLREGADD